ncbi:MAG TPA: Rossmann-like and DUF2520 domain-containing protein [Pyrinomonadaceae bacterium]|jgi:predicted short-subunit dehydrogenase-like oxidoreductase (DUF2520 family)
MAAKRTEPAADGRRAQQQPPHTRRRKPTLSIIGAGRLGTALAIALDRCGYRIEALVARRLGHARRAASLIRGGTLALTAKQLALLPPSDLLFITTPDDAVLSSARDLAATVSIGSRQRRTALHTSGALSSTVLSPLHEAGFHVGSMHPLVSVSDPLSGAESLQEAFYCVEGDASAVRAARAIVRSLGGQSFSINTEDKALYHAAAVMSSGHVVALIDIAIEMLVGCGLTPSRARSVLMPLLRSTLENLSALEPADALTGTFARADIATVRSHLRALREHSPHEALAAYRLLGQRSLRLAEKKGMDATALKAITLTLKDDDGSES